MPSFNYKSEKIEFELIYKKRRTIEIRIDPPGRVIVTAPSGADEDEILKIVQNKGHWITKKLRDVKNINIKEERDFKDGDLFLYMGNDYPLKLIIEKNVKNIEVKYSSENIIVISPSADKELIRKAMKLWYREKTEEIIHDRMKELQKYFDRKPSDIKIKEQKKRWASCTSKGRLLFNWRCSMASVQAVDYIIVHEMCHLYHMNHSKSFWNKVSSVLPDYRKRSEWLKNNALKIDL